MFRKREQRCILPRHISFHPGWLDRRSRAKTRWASRSYAKIIVNQTAVCGACDPVAEDFNFTQSRKARGGRIYDENGLCVLKNFAPWRESIMPVIRIWSVWGWPGIMRWIIQRCLRFKKKERDMKKYVLIVLMLFMVYCQPGATGGCEQNCADNFWRCFFIVSVTSCYDATTCNRDDFNEILLTCMYMSEQCQKTCDEKGLF